MSGLPSATPGALRLRRVGLLSNLPFFVSFVFIRRPRPDTAGLLLIRARSNLKGRSRHSPHLEERALN